MLFIIIFSLGIAGVTITEAPIVIFLLRSPVFILFLLSKVSSRGSEISFVKKWFFVFSGACGLALVSWQIYQFRYSTPAHQSRNLSTGTIKDIIGSGKYLYTDNQSEYLLYSQKHYIPGNKIRLVARNSLKLTDLPQLSSLTRNSIFYSGFNAQKRSKMKGYRNILYETNSIFLSSGTLKGFPKIRYSLRKKLEQTYQNKQTAGLVLGMLIGDKSKFSKSEYQLFINSGLVHLVAVSGGNIVMLVTFLTAILFFVPFYARIILILLAVLSYGILCGMDSSVLRAVLMGSLSLIALLVGRITSLRRMLGLVHIGMLVYNPYFLVYDVGYILSFSAVLGIIFIDVFRFSSQIKVPKILKPIYRIRNNYLKPSLGATLGIFPVIIFFMGQINIGGIVGNMFVLPLVPLIMIGGFIGSFLASGLQKYYITIIDVLVAWNYKVATLIDTYGITIIANGFRIKMLIFGGSTTMMIFVIKKLVTTTSEDTGHKEVDTLKTTPYDDILGTLSVELPKKP